MKPGEAGTFHEQIGYWLWEPATKTVILSLAIPRAQVALAAGIAEPDATEFEVSAERGSVTFGICSGPFLDQAFTTNRFSMKITIHPDGRWSYDEIAELAIRGRAEPLLHRDRATLRKVAAPALYPLAAARSHRNRRGRRSAPKSTGSGERSIRVALSGRRRFHCRRFQHAVFELRLNGFRSSHL